MKELSIEDKAKCYDEAIIKFKQIYDLAKEQGRTIDVKEFENIFPELKKFEDDDIKKWLIGYFNQYIIDGMPQVFCNGLNVKDVIAWLEKQGEQKSIEWSGKIGYKCAEGKLKEMLDRKEKPAWSEEDNVFFKAIIRDIENVQYISEDAKKDRINWLTDLKERYAWKQSDEQMEQLHNVFNNISARWEDSVIESLYNDLNKLKG